MKLTDRDIERFWTKVDKKAEVECWNWMGSKRNGYGAFCVQHRNKGAHRASYVISGGTLTEGLVIRHLCNNKSCVNPNHLAQGTHQENQNDRIAAGTLCLGKDNPASRLNPNSAPIRKVLSEQKRGSRNPQSKLTQDQVDNIRFEYGFQGATQLELAKRYGVRDSTISRILSGKRRAAA